MRKHTYFVHYKVRPNKRTEGVDYATKLTFNAQLDKDTAEFFKAKKVLAKMHRVNDDAILISGWEKVKTRLALVESVQRKLRLVLAMLGLARA